MASRITKENDLLFQCDECRMLYKELKWALKCEAFCKKNRQCSLEIMEHAV